MRADVPLELELAIDHDAPPVDVAALDRALAALLLDLVERAETPTPAHRGDRHTGVFYSGVTIVAKEAS
jgi:hypothetical protein